MKPAEPTGSSRPYWFSVGLIPPTAFFSLLFLCYLVVEVMSQVLGNSHSADRVNEESQTKLKSLLKKAIVLDQNK